MKSEDRPLSVLAIATTVVALLGIGWYLVVDVWARPSQWYAIACGASLVGPLAAMLFLRSK